jgi:hypothetical protein
LYSHSKALLSKTVSDIKVAHPLRHPRQLVDGHYTIHSDERLEPGFSILRFGLKVAIENPGSANALILGVGA